MFQKKFVSNANPWHPMDNPIDVKHLGKLCEELGEAQSAASRCLIQGINEREPSTNKLNKKWIEDEFADVLANLKLCIKHFKLDRTRMNIRIKKKTKHLISWYKMA